MTDEQFLFEFIDRYAVSRAKGMEQAYDEIMNTRGLAEYIRQLFRDDIRRAECESGNWTSLYTEFDYVDYMLARQVLVSRQK